MDARKKSTRSGNASDFTLIYEAAKDENHVALAGLIEKNVCVDVSDHQGLFTPAAKLAAEGNHRAVQLLQDLGASHDRIAMGYASAGYREQAEQLRKNYGANIKHLVIGAAMHADHTYSDQLRQKYNLHPEWLIFGATLAGHDDYVRALIPTSNQEKKQLEKSVCARLRGLVIGGFIFPAMDILNGPVNSDSDLLLKIAIKAAASVADKELLGKLLIRNGTNRFILDDYNHIAAIGAAKGGHLQLARQLIDKTNRRDEQIALVVKAGMKHGHFNETIKHFSDLLKVDQQSFLSHKLTLHGALRGNHRHILERIRKSETTISTLNANYNELAALLARHGDVSLTAEIFLLHKISPVDIVKAMDHGGHFYNEKLLVHAMAFINNHAFLSTLSDAALVLKSDRDAEQSLKTMMQGWTSIFDTKCFSEFKKHYNKAIKINVLMNKYEFDFDQAEVFLESPALRSLLSFVAFRGPAFMATFANKLSDLFGLEPDDLKDIAEKYMFFIAKSFVDKELDAYVNRNYYALYQHYNRAQSFKKACAESESRTALRSLVNFQHGLFNGDIMVTPDHNRQKHEQPLANPGKEDDFCLTIEKIYNNPRLTK